MVVQLRQCFLLFAAIAHATVAVAAEWKAVIEEAMVIEWDIAIEGDIAAVEGVERGIADLLVGQGYDAGS